MEGRVEARVRSDLAANHFNEDWYFNVRNINAHSTAANLSNVTVIATLDDNFQGQESANEICVAVLESRGVNSVVVGNSQSKLAGC